MAVPISTYSKVPPLILGTYQKSPTEMLPVQQATLMDDIRQQRENKKELQELGQKDWDFWQYDIATSPTTLSNEILTHYAGMAKGDITGNTDEAVKTRYNINRDFNLVTNLENLSKQQLKIWEDKNKKVSETGWYNQENIDALKNYSQPSLNKDNEKELNENKALLPDYLSDEQKNKLAQTMWRTKHEPDIKPNPAKETYEKPIEIVNKLRASLENPEIVGSEWKNPDGTYTTMYDKLNTVEGRKEALKGIYPQYKKDIDNSFNNDLTPEERAKYNNDAAEWFADTHEQYITVKEHRQGIEGSASDGWGGETDLSKIAQAGGRITMIKAVYDGSGKKIDEKPQHLLNDTNLSFYPKLTGDMIVDGGSVWNMETGEKVPEWSGKQVVLAKNPKITNGYTVTKSVSGKDETTGAYKTYNVGQILMQEDYDNFKNLKGEAKPITILIGNVLEAPGEVQAGETGEKAAPKTGATIMINFENARGAIESQLKTAAEKQILRDIPEYINKNSEYFTGKLTYNGYSATRDEWKEQGWTDEQIDKYMK